MSDRFDPELIFSVIPSFYRDRLGAADRLFLSTLWEGFVRCADANYAEALQLARSIRPAEAAALTFYPWVFHEFSTWEPRAARHQHVVQRAAGSSSGIFYFSRFCDPSTARAYYAGRRRDISSPSFISIDPDEKQLYAHYFAIPLVGRPRMFGSRLELLAVSGDDVVPDTSFAPGAEVVLESASELLRNRITGDGVITGYDVEWFRDDLTATVADIDVAAATVSVAHQCLWMFETYSDPAVKCPGFPGLAGVAVDDPEAEHPTITWPDGFKRGQVLEFVRFGLASLSAYRYREIVDVDGPTYTIKRAKADCRNLSLGLVNLVLDIPLYPRAFEITSQFVRFFKALPPGVRVRVTDPSGSQSFESDGLSMSFRLGSPVDPDIASVFVFNIDLAAVTVTARRFELGRPLPVGVVAECAAPYWLPHDHARWSTTLLSAASSVDLPADRPMALAADLTMDPRYPVKVYVNGVLQATTVYTFPSTVRIQKASGTFAAGSMIDVVYVDAEAVEDHVHARSRVDLADGAATSSATVSGLSSRYPVEVEEVGAELLAAAASPLQQDRVVQLRPPVSGPATLFIDGAEAGHHFQATLPARVDEADGYAGTLMSAEFLQDGIDSPEVVLDADQFSLVRVGPDTRVRSAVAFSKAWFKNAQVDEHLIQNNLGLAVGVLDPGETTEAYRLAVLALFAASWSNSSVATIENFASIILGSEFCPAGSNRGVRRTSAGAVRVVRTDDNEDVQVELHPTIPPRPAGALISRMFAVSGHAQVVDVSDIPGLPVFAQTLSPDFGYAKRLDVRKPREVVGVVDAFSSATLILESATTDFIASEVWVGDLVKLTIDNVSDPVFTWVDEVMSEHAIRLRTTPLVGSSAGWGDLGFGAVTGWGGYIVDADVESFTIWSRITRPVDAGLFLDEMFDALSALADGESYQRAHSRLSAILRHHVFGLKIHWDAAVSSERLGYLKALLQRVKPAETYVFPYVEAVEGAVVDAATPRLADHGAQVDRVMRTTMVGLFFVGSGFVGADVEAVALEPSFFGSAWWAL